MSNKIRPWSNQAKVVYKRTYARKDNGKLERWEDTVYRAIKGNIRNHKVTPEEINRLEHFLLNRKATPAGRGLWFSGAPSHETLGGAALNNCWYLNGDSWQNLAIAQDLLMLGGGVGMSVEHRYISKLPKVKKDIAVTHRPTKDAYFIVPDSREGWCQLLYKTLEAYFDTGKSFDYSTVCVRGANELIKGFGGKSSGPLSLIMMIEKISKILDARAGKHVRPCDFADILCCVAEMVVSGNVRRSALMILGDAFDKEFLRMKRWDLATLPSQRSNANFSVIVEDYEDLGPLFWKTYEIGEPFGIFNRKNARKYARMGELKPDNVDGVNPCVPAGTEILTDRGYIAIEEVVDQRVNVWNGFEFSEVTPKVTGYDQPMVKVTLSSGQTLICTEAHNFVIATDYKGSAERVSAVSLEPGMKLIKTDFPVLKSGKHVEYAYSQGFYSGDGNSNDATAWIYENKRMCVNRLNGKEGKINTTQSRSLFKFNFDVHSKNFVPLDWSLESKLNWLAGLLDSDGCELREGGSQISSVDKQFLLGIQKMLTTLGTPSKVVSMKDSGDKLMPDGKGGQKEYYCQSSYRILIGSTQMQELKKLGLKCERLSFDKSPQRDASQFPVVVDVSEYGFASTVYCFTEPKRNMGCFNGIVTGQCAEAMLVSGEPCNLWENALHNLDDATEFAEASRIGLRWTKRITCERYHHKISDDVIKKNRRVGLGITGCLMSSLFNPKDLDFAYGAIQDEDRKYSKELGIPESIRTTVVKPSGTISKVHDACGYEGIHAAYSRYMIQRIRFSANDPMVPLLRAAGHHMEPEYKLDGTLDHNTLVVDFYQQAPDGYPVADEDWDLFKQLDVVKMAQKHWADQSVSVTVYYKKEEIPALKEWLANNLSEIKTISFLCHSEHGYKQAPKEAISKEQYEKLAEKITPVDLDALDSVGEEVDSQECAGGVCPVK